MLAALGVDEVGGLLVCCRPPSPRALEPERRRQGRDRPRRAATTASRSSTRVAEAVERRAARHARRRPDRDHRLALRRRRGPLRARALIDGMRVTIAAGRGHRGQRDRAGAPRARCARSTRGRSRRCATSTPRAPRRPAPTSRCRAFTDVDRDVRERRGRRGRRSRRRPGRTAQLARDALDAGMHVYCEKPITPTRRRGLRARARTRATRNACSRSGSSSGSTRATPRCASAFAELGPLRRVHVTATNWFRPQAYFDESPWRADLAHGRRRRADEPGRAPGRRVDRRPSACRRGCTARVRNARAPRRGRGRSDRDARVAGRRARHARRVAQRARRRRAVRAARRARRGRARRRLRRAASRVTTTRTRASSTSCADEFPEHRRPSGRRSRSPRSQRASGST